MSRELLEFSELIDEQFELAETTYVEESDELLESIVLLFL